MGNHTPAGPVTVGPAADRAQNRPCLPPVGLCGGVWFSIPSGKPYTPPWGDPIHHKALGPLGGSPQTAPEPGGGPPAGGGGIARPEAR